MSVPTVREWWKYCSWLLCCALPWALSGVQCCAADTHTCVLLKTGDVKCFGENAYGQLGAAPLPSQTPHLCPHEPFQNVKSAAASVFSMVNFRDNIFVL
eukprot:5055885-Amphidinium_carterae.8